MWKMGKVFKNWIGMNGFKMKTKNVKFSVVGSRCRQNLKVGRRRQRNVLKTCQKSCNSVINGVYVAVVVPKTPYFPAALIFNFSIKRWTLLSLHWSLPKLWISFGNLPTPPSPCFCLSLPAWSKCFLKWTSVSAQKPSRSSFALGPTLAAKK